jgi:hypothetical protein
MTQLGRRVCAAAWKTLRFEMEARRHPALHHDHLGKAVLNHLVGGSQQRSAIPPFGRRETKSYIAGQAPIPSFGIVLEIAQLEECLL